MTPRAATPAAPRIRPHRGRAGTRDVADDLGLTLLEMLIILAVIAVATGVTTLSFGPHHEEAATAEAGILAAAISRAADRSLVTGGRAALVIDARGYVLDGTRHLLPPTATLGGVSAGVPLPIDDRPFVVEVDQGGERWHVAFDGLRATAVNEGAGA